MTNSFLKEREKVIKKIDKQIKSKRKYACITKTGKLISKIKILSRIGTESLMGEAFSACYPIKCKYSLAIKKIPLSSKDEKFIKDQTSKKALVNSPVWAELFFLKLTNFLVINKVCPNLPFYYTHYICKNCEYQNPNLSKENKECVIVINEKADGDLKNFIILETKKYLEEGSGKEGIKKTILLVLVAYYQIFMGLYCIRKYFNIWHHDLHWGNVLFHRIKSTGYIKYIVNKKEMNIPNIGYLFVLWDFGFSRIPKKIEPKMYKNNYKNENSSREDFTRISSMLLKDDLQTSTILDGIGKYLFNLCINTIKTNKDIPELLNKLYKDIEILSENNVNKGNVIDTFDTDKILKSNDSVIGKYLLH